MPVYQCVQCFDCCQFQSTQVRKDKKFSCKLCGKKQSVRKMIARSESGAELRKVVQRLNLARGTAQEAYERTRTEGLQFGEEAGQVEQVEALSFVDPLESRWREIAVAADIAEGKYEDSLVKHEVYTDEEEEEKFVTSVPDAKVYTTGRRRNRSSTENGRRRGESGALSAVGGVCKPDRKSAEPNRRQNAKNSHSRNSKNVGFDYTPSVRKHDGHRTQNTLANFDGDDSSFFTTTGADTAFEEEVMP